MPDAEFVQFMVVEIVNGKHVGLGLQRFRVAPRTNEYISRDVDGKGHVYKVIAVVHPLVPVGAAGDLIIEHLGTEIEIRNLLAGG